MGDFIQGRSRLTLAAREGREFRALLAVLVSGGDALHRLDLVVDPAWEGRVEPPLIDAALEHLANFPSVDMQAEVDTRRVETLTALERAGFRRIRILDRMALDIDRQVRY
jgi:hypothetical protein